MNKPTYQSGAVTFFIAVFVLPLLLLVFSLSMEVSHYQLKIENLQQTVDEAALRAYRFLPYQERSRAAANDYLRLFSDPSALEINVDNHSVTIDASSHYSPDLISFLGENVQLPIRAVSRVWTAPIDAMILMDSSSYLAPAVTGDLWGDESEWPAAYFFSSLHPVKLNGVPIDPRLLTQYCFNPAFSALKRAAIKSYEYLSSPDFNLVGVGFYPGTLSHLDLARPTTQAGPLGPNLGEANIELNKIEPFARNEWCAASAQEEIFHLDYRFPAGSSEIPVNWTPGNYDNEQIISSGTWSYNQEYQKYLRTNEAIWSRAVFSNATSDFIGALEEAESNLFGAVHLESRKSLAAKTKKVLLIFSGDVPWAGGIRFPDSDLRETLANSLAATAQKTSEYNTDLRLSYVLFNHSGNQTGFSERVSELREVFDQVSQQSNQQGLAFRADLVVADSETQLVTKTLANLLLQNRSGYVAR